MITAAEGDQSFLEFRRAERFHELRAIILKRGSAVINRQEKPFVRYLLPRAYSLAASPRTFSIVSCRVISLARSTDWSGWD
jgi:hypothetical protein